MKNDVESRITERSRIAHLRMKHQGWFGRSLSRLGLATANGMDLLTASFDNDRAVFMGATAGGLVRGAIYGVLAAFFIVAALGPIGPLAFLGMIAASAAGYGIYDGQTQLEQRLTSKKERLSDEIAEKSGAVPEKEKAITQSPDETAGQDAALEQKAVATEKELEAEIAKNKAATPPFTARASCSTPPSPTPTR